MKTLEEIIERLKCLNSWVVEIENDNQKDWIEKIQQLQILREEIWDIGEIMEHRYFSSCQNSNKKLILKADDMQYKLSNKIKNLIEEIKEEDNESLYKMMYPNEEDREFDFF